jgi:UDP-N-acetylglucosamine acyltransferase
VIHPTAIIGDPPEMRGYTGEGLMPKVDPTARVEAFVTIDAGVDRRTTIGPRTWLMKKVHIGHDALVGEDCEIAPLSSIGGYVEIGDRVKVGQGATFKPCVKVGDDARIGMGAVVVKNVPAGETWVGNPARQLFPVPLPEEEAAEMRRKLLEPVR